MQTQMHTVLFWDQLSPRVNATRDLRLQRDTEGHRDPGTNPDSRRTFPQPKLQVQPRTTSSPPPSPPGPTIDRSAGTNASLMVVCAWCNGG